MTRVLRMATAIAIVSALMLISLSPRAHAQGEVWAVVVFPLTVERDAAGVPVSYALAEPLPEWPSVIGLIPAGPAIVGDRRFATRAACDADRGDVSYSFTAIKASPASDPVDLDARGWRCLRLEATTP